MEQLISVRDVKRAKLQSLFEEQEAIKQQMKDLERNLMDLDEEIDALEEQEFHATMADEEFDGNVNVKREPQSIPLTMNPEEHLEDPSTQLQFTQRQTQADPGFLTDPNDLTQATPPGHSVERSNVNNPYSRSNQSIAAPLAPLDLTAASNIKRDSNFNSNSSNSNVARKPPPAATLDDYLTAPSLKRKSSATSAANQSENLPLSCDNFTWSNQVQRLLQNTFRIQSFRDHQKEIINATLSGKDAFVIMRTGGGKSLTYQLPALLEGQASGKITMVVSPLLSLIKDQEDQMNAFFPNSALSFTSGLVGGNAEHVRRWGLVRDPSAGVCLIFVTPEKVHNSGKLKAELQKLHEQGRLGRFVIDECHCACQWGHDFRPDYAKLGILKAHFPTVPILAVTATASDKVRQECIHILQMNPQHLFFRSTANRPNLNYSVKLKDDGKDAVLDDMAYFIQEKWPTGAGIIYTYSKKDADTVADRLLERGIVAEAYHSDVSAMQKDHIHSSWMRNETQVVVATIAFGLGINKPDVRFVLHHTLSKTLEAYYQESGRAGRDGTPADCVLYYSPKDVTRMIRMVHGQSSERLYWTMVRYAQEFGNDEVCRAIILKNLGEPNAPDANAAIARNNDTVESREVTKHAITALQLLRHKTMDQQQMTLSMLVKEWRATKNAPQFVLDNPPKELTVTECELIIVELLIKQDILDIDVVWTAYDSVMYLKFTPTAQRFLDSDKARMSCRFPKREPKKKAASRTSVGSAEGGWLQTKTKAKAKGSTSKKPAAKKTTKAKSKAKAKPKTTKKKATTTKKKPAPKKAPAASAAAATVDPSVIEVIDSSSDEEDNSPRIASLRTRTPQKRTPENYSSDFMESDDECEFDG